MHTLPLNPTYAQISCLAILLLSRISLPLQYNQNGAGINAIEMNPSKLLPQSSPRRENKAEAKSGKAAPKTLRKRSLPAYTEAM